MKKRLVSAMIMLPLLILVVLGGLPLYLGGLVLMGVALHEFYNAFDIIQKRPIYEIGYAFVACMFLAILFVFDTGAYAFILFILFLVAIIYVLRQKRDVIDLSLTFSGILYICFCFNYIILISERLDRGHIYVWLVFIIAFLTDTFAYFVGRRFGRHKLMPKTSPKKTIEGSIGGIAGSTIACIVFGLIFKLPIGIMVIIAIFGSIIAQMGDLIASAIKRYVGIKDYGKLIPGHGGVLDRFDSVLLVAPYVYFVLVYLLK